MSEENVEVVRRGYAHLRHTGELPWELIDEESSCTTRPSTTQRDGRRPLDPLGCHAEGRGFESDQPL